MATSPTPQIADTAARFFRTVIQAALAVVSFAPVYPLIVSAIHAPAGSKAAALLTVAGVWISAAAGIISRLMAIPAVNTVLGKIKLAGHSGTVTASDTWTTYNPVITAPADTAAADAVTSGAVKGSTTPTAY